MNIANNPIEEPTTNWEAGGKFIYLQNVFPSIIQLFSIFYWNCWGFTFRDGFFNARKFLWQTDSSQ